MRITKDFPGLKDIGWAYEYEGSIESDDEIEIDLGDKWLKVSGGINAGTYIEAGWGIQAGWGIKAGWGIQAGSGIQADEGIEAGWGIKAGEGIQAGSGILSGLSVKCKKVLSFKFNLFAGTATFRKASPEDQIVECLRVEGGGTIVHGTLRLLGRGE